MSISLDIPGYGRLELEGVVCDMNGTLTRDGQLATPVAEALRDLAGSLKIYVMTADTFGTARKTFAYLPVELVGMETGRPGAEVKRDFVRRLGAERHAAVGNGRNDHLMLAAAALGICVIGPEGAPLSTLQAADLVVADPVAALELLNHPRRLLAGLRN
jgi:soluble P-type ATPase